MFEIASAIISFYGNFSGFNQLPGGWKKHVSILFSSGKPTNKSIDMNWFIFWLLCPSAFAFRLIISADLKFSSSAGKTNKKWGIRARVDRRRNDVLTHTGPHFFGVKLLMGEIYPLRHNSFHVGNFLLQIFLLHNVHATLFLFTRDCMPDLFRCTPRNAEQISRISIMCCDAQPMR